MNTNKNEIADAIHIWNNAAISLLDIRHNLISPKEAILGYRLPASAFVYTAGAKSEVIMGNVSYHIERFGLFHGGKGTELSIQPIDNWLEYYIILYKAGEPPVHKKEYARLLERTNPFCQQYGFSPNKPLFFGEQLRKMYERWIDFVPLNLFYGKAAFYQLVYEIYEELERGQVSVLHPDYAAMARRYMEEHYDKAVSIAGMADILGISTRQLARIFKERTGKSTKEYLMEVRLKAAKDLLLRTNSTLSEIASATGFNDEFYFSRRFKDRFEVSPLAFRRNPSWKESDLFMGNFSFFRYNEESLVSLSKLKEEGVYSMMKQIKNKAAIAAVVSVLLLSACQSGTPAAVSDQPVQPETIAEETAVQVEEETRVVKTVMGDVEVPRNPQRIVTSGFWVGDILALGKQPIAIQDFYVTTSAWSEQVKNITVLEKWEPEYIMALEPDLIITGAFSGQAADYEELSKIAPTVAFDWEEEPEERLPLMAQVLGLDAADGEALVNEYNQKIEDYRKKLEAAGVLDKTITVFRNVGVGEGGLELGSDLGWGGEVVYALFGMPMPEAVQELHAQEDASGTVSFEVIPKLCGDYILLNQSDSELIKQLEDNTIWQSIPAVQEGNILVVEPGKVYFPDIITDTYKLEVISEALLELAEN